MLSLDRARYVVNFCCAFISSMEGKKRCEALGTGIEVYDAAKMGGHGAVRAGGVSSGRVKVALTLEWEPLSPGCCATNGQRG